MRYASHEEPVARSAETSESHSLEVERGLQMRKQHLDFLSHVSRPFELRRARKLAGLIAHVFVDASRDFPSLHIWAAAGLEFACFAVLFARAVNHRSGERDTRAQRREGAIELLERFAGRTNVLVLIGIEDEVGAAEGSILARAFVPNRNMRRCLFLRQLIKELTRSVSGVSREAFGLQDAATRPRLSRHDSVS